MHCTCSDSTENIGGSRNPDDGWTAEVVVDLETNCAQLVCRLLPRLGWCRGCAEHSILSFPTTFSAGSNTVHIAGYSTSSPDFCCMVVVPGYLGQLTFVRKQSECSGDFAASIILHRTMVLTFRSISFSEWMVIKSSVFARTQHFDLQKSWSPIESHGMPHALESGGRERRGDY